MTKLLSESIIRQIKIIVVLGQPTRLAGLTITYLLTFS